MRDVGNHEPTWSHDSASSVETGGGPKEPSVDHATAGGEKPKRSWRNRWTRVAGDTGKTEIKG
jgi:hypothetical protein